MFVFGKFGPFQEPLTSEKLRIKDFEGWLQTCSKVLTVQETGQLLKRRAAVALVKQMQDDSRMSRGSNISN